MNNTPKVDQLYLGIFAVKGQGVQVVEVPNTQKPEIDRAAAWAAIKKKFPKHRPDEIRRTSEAFKTRPVGGEPVIEVAAGSTIRQLFEGSPEHEAAREVGAVVFNGQPCAVILRHLRSKSAFAVTLKEISGGNANLSAQNSVMRLVSELPMILETVFGGAARDLKLNITIRPGK